MKIKTEFTADNLTIFGGYFNIFNFFVKSNIFKKLDKFISVKKRKKKLSSHISFCLWDQRTPSWYFKARRQLLFKWCSWVYQRTYDNDSLWYSSYHFQSILLFFKCYIRIKRRCNLHLYPKTVTIVTKSGTNWHGQEKKLLLTVM